MGSFLLSLSPFLIKKGKIIKPKVNIHLLFRDKQTTIPPSSHHGGWSGLHAVQAKLAPCRIKGERGVARLPILEFE